MLGVGGGRIGELEPGHWEGQVFTKKPKNNQKGFFLMPPPQKAPLGTFSGSFFEGRFIGRF